MLILLEMLFLRCGVVEIGQYTVMLLEVKQERFNDKRGKDLILCEIFRNSSYRKRRWLREMLVFLPTIWLRYFVAIVGIHQSQLLTETKLAVLSEKVESPLKKSGLS